LRIFATESIGQRPYAWQWSPVNVLNRTRSGHETSVKVLIDAGCDIEVKNSNEETALCCAVRNGKLGAVRVLLDDDALIENKEDIRRMVSPPDWISSLMFIPCFSRSTALHVASKKGYETIVRLLLDKGATIDRRDEESNTALDLAISGGHRDVALVLVEAKDWRKIMTPKDIVLVGRRNRARVTPLRKLLSKFPDVAKIVLKKCIDDGNDEKSDLYSAVYDFSLIDDTYMMPSEDGRRLIGDCSPYHEDGKLKNGARAYSEDYGVVYENHPLKLMVRTFKGLH
ncbi:ankyrin repeat protein, partial [Ancylostoma duodenale]